MAAEEGSVTPELEQESMSARYDMTPEEAQALCHDFLTSAAAQAPSGKYGCYVINGADRFSNLGRFIESSVFGETFDNPPELTREEYSPYDQSSEFYVVIDQEAELPIGVMRIIKNSEAGLKSLDDLERVNIGFTKEDVYRGYGVDPKRCADIATLAVLPDYRGAKAAYLPSLLMYRTLFLQVLNDPEFDHVVAIIDKDAERGLRTLKFPFEPIFGSDYFSYLDSPKSRAVIAKNSMFHPQLTYWSARLKSQAQGKEAPVETMLANTMYALINPDYLDQMLASTPAADSNTPEN